MCCNTIAWQPERGKDSSLLYQVKRGYGLNVLACTMDMNVPTAFAKLGVG